MGELREDAEVETLLAQENERLELVDNLRDALRQEVEYLRRSIAGEALSFAATPTIEDFLPLLAALSAALDEGAI